MLQPFAFALDAISFSYITKQNGLSDSNVECIYKDSDGFIWFGTRNGLCRFDGYEIKIYKKTDNQNSLSGNRILDITEDKQGNLWIGTLKDGLNCFDRETEIFVHYGFNEGIGDRVNKIKVFKDSSIWICSNRGLAYLNQNTDSFKTYYNPEQNGVQINSGLVYDIIETSNSEVYIATENNEIQQLNRKKNSLKNIKYARLPELTSNYRKTLIEDSKGIIWITASYHGLCSYNPANGESEIYTQQKNNLSTNKLMGNMDIDSEGNLWICTEEDGINIFNVETKHFTHLKRNKNIQGSLNSDHIYSIYFDNENIAWIGTFDKGINIYNPYQRKFNASLFSPNDLDVLNDYSVLDIFEDSKKRVWMGTDGFGLFKFEKNKAAIQYNNHDKNSFLSSNVITSLAEDPLGNILIGTYSGGLISLNPDKNIATLYYPLNKPGSISSPHVWEVFADSRNRIWLGMLASGADEYNYKTHLFRNLGPYSTEVDKIDFQNVMTINEDRDGDIWFGTEGKGIFILDKETDRIIRIANDSTYKFPTEGIIKCIIQDKWGAIWIGTEDNGLFKYDKKKHVFSKFGKPDGFTSDPVQSLAEDTEGNIWIGTTSGLFKLNTQSHNFSRFIIEDGLSSNDFNPDAMCKLSDGRIIAGTNNRAEIISLDNINLNTNLPKLVFTKLSVLSKQIQPNMLVNDRMILTKSITYTPELKLNWKDKVFSLEFAALNYTLPQKCQYKYMLDGFDEDWIYTDSKRRIATYSNLDAGDYIFRVKASNNDGKWGNNQIALKIKVTPPFWETLAFKLSLILLLGLIIYIIFKQRIKTIDDQFKQHQLEQEQKIITLENEKLESELKKLAFNILSKNKLLLDHKTRIQNLSNKAKESVKEGLQKIVDSIDEDLNEEKDWKIIEPQIDKAYNQFISKLKQNYPDLTATEMRIAAYIRMNLSTKEISELLNKTQRAIENDRYRLRKKIGLGTNDSIQHFFLNL